METSNSGKGVCTDKVSPNNPEGMNSVERVETLATFDTLTSPSSRHIVPQCAKDQVEPVFRKGLCNRKEIDNIPLGGQLTTVMVAGSHTMMPQGHLLLRSLAPAHPDNM